MRIFQILLGVLLPSLAAPLTIAKAQPLPVYTWTGFYVGVQAGLSGGSTDATFTGIRRPGATSWSLDMADFGPVGGFTAGYNYQLWGTPWVIGVEGDWNGANITGRTDCLTGIFDCQTTISNFFTARGRVGYAAGSILVYATGGYAGATFQYSKISLGTTPSSAVTQQLSGYTVGGGIEDRIAQFGPNALSLKGELDWSGLGRGNFDRVSAGESGFTIKGGLNFSFAWRGF